MKPTNFYHTPLKNAYRPFAVIVLAACSWTDVTLAQDAASPVNPAATDASAPPATGAAVNPSGATGSAPSAAAEKTQSPFRVGESTRAGSAPKKSPFAYESGQSEPRKSKPARKFTDPDPDAEQPVVKAADSEESETRLVAPNFYGRGPQVVTPGKGQYARPKFRYGLSVGLGYDDNPDQVSNTNLTTVARPRNGSGFTYVNGHWDAQWLKPRTAFTVNLEVGGNFYWDRPGNSSDLNTRLGILYINKLDPRTQLSTNASFAFLSQPDYSNLYASNSQSGGDYFSGSTKFDLSYKWARHFSTVTSASVNLLKYVDEVAGGGTNSFWNFTFGNEFRFQSSPRLTWVIEGRYALDEYINNSNFNSQTASALVGLDWIASRRMTATFRTGASFRSYDAGGSSSAPYAEVSLNYQTGRHSSMTLNARYGYDQSTAAGDENLSYRLGLVYQHAFTSRFSGNAGFNFVHTDYNPRTGASSGSDIYDLNIGFQYRIDRHFSLSTRYSYTLQDTSTGSQDFDRNRVLFSLQYEY